MKDNSRVVKKKRRRKGSKRRKILWFILIILLIIIGYVGYSAFITYNAANGTYSELARGEKSKLREEVVQIEKDPISILLLGVEDYSSGGHNGRADTIMVATLNPDDQTMKLLSIPRDTYVYIPEKGYSDKINHSFGSGGKDSTIETVEELLEIPIDYYATVSFEGFRDIIDELGGVKVNVPFDFSEKSDIDNHWIHFYEGPATLDGEKALAYARMRKQDPRGDFGRNDRQKEIITASIDKLMNPSTLFKIDDIATHVKDSVETNLKVSQGLAFQKLYSGLSSSKIEKLTIEGYDDRMNGVYYFIPDDQKLEELKSVLKQHLGQEPSDSTEITDKETETEPSESETNY